MIFFLMGCRCFCKQKKTIFLELSQLKAINLKRPATFWFYWQGLYVYLKTTTRFEPVSSRVGNRCFVSLIPCNTTGFYRHEFICDRWISKFFAASGLWSKEIMFNPFFFPDGL